MNPPVELPTSRHVLPFAESDFILSIIGEELGFFGIIIQKKLSLRKLSFPRISVTTPAIKAHMPEIVSSSVLQVQVRLDMFKRRFMQSILNLVGSLLHFIKHIVTKILLKD